MVDILARTIYRKGHQSCRKQLFLNKWKWYTQAIKEIEKVNFTAHLPSEKEIELKQATI